LTYHSYQIGFVLAQYSLKNIPFTFIRVLWVSLLVLASLVVAVLGKEASKVKEGEKIIEDEEFYQRFFEEIEEGIKNLKEAQEKTKEN